MRTKPDKSVRLILPFLSNLCGSDRYIGAASFRTSTMEIRPISSPVQPVEVFYIDSINQRVALVSYDGSLEQLYEWINCVNIDYIARQPSGDGIFCNDLLPDIPQQVAFRLRSTGQIIYGNGVWTGSNEEGDTVAPAASLMAVTSEIEFLGPISYEPEPIYIFSW